MMLMKVHYTVFIMWQKHVHVYPCKVDIMHKLLNTWQPLAFVWYTTSVCWKCVYCVSVLNCLVHTFTQRIINLNNTGAQFGTVYVHLLSNVVEIWTKFNKWLVNIIESLKPLIKYFTMNYSNYFAMNNI